MIAVESMMNLARKMKKLEVTQLEIKRVVL